MKFKKFLILSILSVIVTTACNQKDIEQGIGYTEYINSLDLEKKTIESHTNGSDKAVVFCVKGDENANIVKEIHYYEDGTIQVEGTLKDKKRHGIWTFYHENGNIWSTGEFNEGKSEGCFNVFDPEGHLKIKSYYENNKKVKEEYYKNNKLDQSVDLL